MLIRELLTELRARLSDNPTDSTARCYSDEDLLRVIHAEMRGIATELTDSDNDFYVAEVELYAADAVQVHDGQWLYDLPPFVHHIAPDGVRKASSETESRTAAEHRLVVPRPYTGGWRVDEDGMLVWRGEQAEDLIVRVAKMPARPFWATLSETASDPSRITLPVASSITGGVHIEHDAYIGMRLAVASQVTGGDVACVGELRRVVQSIPVDVAGTSRVELVLHRPFSSVPGLGAVVESSVQVPDFALSYLMHQATIQAQARRNRPMTDGLAQLGRVEAARFMSARHRDESGPKHYAPDLDAQDWRRWPSADYYTEAF